MRHCNRSTRKRITRRLFLLTRVHQAARKHETLVNPSCSLRNLSFLDYSDSFPNSSHLKVKIVQGPWLKARYVGIGPVYMFQFAAWNSLYNMCHNKSTYFNRFNIFQVLCVCIPCNEFGTEPEECGDTLLHCCLSDFLTQNPKIFTRFEGCMVLVLIHWWRTQKDSQKHTPHIAYTDAWFCFFFALWQCLEFSARLILANWLEQLAPRGKNCELPCCWPKWPHVGYSPKWHGKHCINRDLPVQWGSTVLDRPLRRSQIFQIQVDQVVFFFFVWKLVFHNLELKSHKIQKEIVYPPGY